MNLEDYAYNEDDRWYVNPQVSLDEQNAFINNLRALQAQDNAQIARQTRDLGTQVPSQLGGLTGGGGYFRARYQTPQTNQTIADLRAVAQQQALNTAMQNEIDKLKKQYNAAYRKASLGGGSGGGTTSDYLEKLQTLFANTKDQGDLQDTEYAGQEEVEIKDAEKSNTAAKDWGGGWQDMVGGAAGLGIGGGLLLGLPGAAIGALTGGLLGARFGKHGLDEGGFWK